jgi:hypothetical protein
MVKLRLDEIENFRRSIEWLKTSSQAIFECFDDKEFKQQLYVCIERCSDIATKLGATEVTVKA